MLNEERKIQILDLTVLMILFFLSGTAGKYVMTYTTDTILGFNGVAIGTMMVGELLWTRVRNNLIHRLDEHGEEEKND